MDSRSCSGASASRWGKLAPSASLSGCPYHQSGPLRGLHTPCYAQHHQQMIPTTAAAATPICAIRHRMQGPTVPDLKAAAAAGQSTSATNAPQSSKATWIRKHPTRRLTRQNETVGTEEANLPHPKGKTTAATSSALAKKDGPRSAKLWHAT